MTSFHSSQDCYFIDIHSHHLGSNEKVFKIYNLSLSDLQEPIGANRSCLKSQNVFFSVGIHPWWIENLQKSELIFLQEKISSLVEKELFVAIGETGLDRLHKMTWPLQMELFIWHAELAEKKNKPMILHCVRSYADILFLIKKINPTVPWIFHDFRGGVEMMNRLMSLHSHSYFSFGPSLLKSPSVYQSLKMVPENHYFFESDDSISRMDVIYQKASEVLEINIDFLKEKVWKNFRHIFPQSIATD